MKLGAFGEAVADLLCQPCYLLVDGLTVVLYGRAANVAARCKHVLMLADRVEVNCGAEAGNVLIRPEGAVLAPPSVVGGADPRNVLGREFAVRARNHVPEGACVDEQHLVETGPPQADPRPGLAGLAGLVARQEPQADRDLRGVEELARQRDNTLHKVSLDEVPTDCSLTGLL